MSQRKFLWKKKHRQTFSWPAERPSSHLKVTEMWFGPKIKYLSGPFFPNLCCRESISCYLYKMSVAKYFHSTIVFIDVFILQLGSSILGKNDFNHVTPLRCITELLFFPWEYVVVIMIFCGNYNLCNEPLFTRTHTKKSQNFFMQFFIILY